MSDKKYDIKDDFGPTTSSRASDGKGVVWTNYDGVKWKSETGITYQYPEPTQFNSKEDGMHKFYSPKSGKMGAAFDERKDK